MSFVEPELIGYQPMVALNDFSLRTDKFHIFFCNIMVLSGLILKKTNALLSSKLHV